MSTPVIEAIDNVNQTSLGTVFEAIAADPTARDNLSQSDRNIDAVATSVAAIEALDTNEDAILRVLCRREGFDPANFADLDAVSADQGLMQAIAARQESSKILARSQKASAAAAASATAMNEIGNSTTARSEVYASSTALSEIRPVSQAIAKLSAGEAGLDPSSYPDMVSIAGDVSAISAIAASQTAIQEVVNSQTAMQDVVASQTAMQEVAASQTAMQEVAESQTALDAIGNNSVVQNTVYNNNTAVSALNSSNLIENANARIAIVDDKTFKNDRVILLSHESGSGGSRTNQPQFGANDNSFPHTADRIRRVNTASSGNDQDTSASFIDISDS